MTITWWYLIPLAFACFGAISLGLATNYPIRAREVKWILIGVASFAMAFLLVLAGVR